MKEKLLKCFKEVPIVAAAKSEVCALARKTLPVPLALPRRCLLLKDIPLPHVKNTTALWKS